MNPDQERTIIKNIVKLVKLTRNIHQLVDGLEQTTVLTGDESQKILNCNDEESSSNLLYEIILRKPAYSFNLLLTCLRNSDNGRLAAILEGCMDPGEHTSTRIRRQSSSERYLKDDSSTTISGSEMGIAELMEEYTDIQHNWPKLYHKFHLIRSEKNLEYYSSHNNIIVRFTLMLRGWVELHKRKATLDNLCKILENEGFDRCSGRIRRMFERYSSSGFEMDISGGYAITGKEEKVASVLEANPSFSVYPERLFLMLNGPVEALQIIHDERDFIKTATRMLTEWSQCNGERATIENLAALVALNGHFHTADKLVSV